MISVMVILAILFSLFSYTAFFVHAEEAEGAEEEVMLQAAEETVEEEPAEPEPEPQPEPEPDRKGDRERTLCLEYPVQHRSHRLKETGKGRKLRRGRKCHLQSFHAASFAGRLASFLPQNQQRCLPGSRQ